jgi:hypothetical protein
MNLKTLRTMVVFSALLFSGSALLAFLTAPYVGSAYLMMLQGMGDQLPNLTAKVALPLLRVSPRAPYGMPQTALWVGVVWLFLAASPWCIMFWSWQSSTQEACLARWFSGIMLYFPATMGLFITVLAGLFVSVAPM